MTEKPFCTIDGKGKITHIDWEEIERLAERHRYLMNGLDIATSLNPVNAGLVAVLALAIREHIIETLQKQPDWQNKP